MCASIVVLPQQDRITSPVLTELGKHQVIRLALPIFAYYGTAQAMRPLMARHLLETGTISRLTEPFKCQQRGNQF